MGYANLIGGVPSVNVMAVNPGWNHLGPPIPLWFRSALRRLDSTLQLQFIPPSTVHPRGMPAEKYPYGGWQICRRMKKTGWLHKLAVWSLMDRFGRYSPPGPDTIRILRLCRNLWNHRKFTVLSDELDRVCSRMKKQREDASYEELMDNMGKFMSLQGNRQFSNRVFHRGWDEGK